MTEAAALGPNNGERRRISEVLSDLADRWPGERLSLGDIEISLGERGFGVLLMVFVIPALIPGVAGIAAIPLAMLALQLIFGLRRPWLPKRLMRTAVARRDFASLVNRMRPALGRVERLLRPRWLPLTASLGERLIGLVCLFLAMLLPLPLPFGNLVAALPIALLALALIERDGIVATIGLSVGLIAGGGYTAVTWVTIRETLQWAFTYLGI